MNKPDRETLLRKGEERLKEWGVSTAGIDGLVTVIGRDPAADLAIAARLGGHTEPASVEALLAMEAGSTDKLVRKEARRSLYRLQQRGLSIPHAAAPTPAPVVAAAAVEGYVSAVDGQGDELVWLVKPRQGGVMHLFAVLNDPDGLREVDLSETTRKALRAGRQELLDKHELRMVDADWRYCDYLIDRAFHWAVERGHTITGDYRGFRARLLKTPVAEMQPLIFAHVDAEAVRREARLVIESHEVLEEKEFRTWFFDRDTLQPYIDEILKVRDSPLVLNQAQQQERFRVLVERAVEELFGGDRQLSWVRRLEEMAYFLYVTARQEQAKRALAAALALEGSTRSGHDIPICEQLVRSGLAAFLQAEEQREQEAARSSLVVTPQQAAREAQRRR